METEDATSSGPSFRPAGPADLHKLYPQNHELLLDGVPVVKDVVATFDQASKISLERTRDERRRALSGYLAHDR